MENIKEQIIEFCKKNNRFIVTDDLKKYLKISGEEQTEHFFDALKVLEEEGSLFFDKKKGYRILTNDLGFAYGKIEINKEGTGFIHTKDGYKIIVDNRNLNGALNGDCVLISSIEYGKRNDFKGEVYKVLKRKNGEVIFEVVGNGILATLIPYDINKNVPIVINKNEYKNLVDGEYVCVKVGTEKVNGEYLAEIQKVIGHKNDADIDINLIYMKHGIPIDFSKEALKEADELPTEVTEDEIEGRVDLRDKRTITIDCDGTKDRDDALYGERLANGNFKLFVSISDLSHYVKRGSKLFEEALNRRTSHYPNNTCNPMFPHKLSNGICSLNENVDRLTKTCEMEITTEGKVVDYNVYKSVIKSRKAMKYSEVNRVLNGEIVEGYEEYTEQLNLLNDISNALESARNNRNCVDFGINDIEIDQDNQRKINGFVMRGNGVAERIIENCMLITGTTIAEHFSWLPFIYRVHEAPSEEAVREVIKILRLSGFDIPKFNNVDEKIINSILDKVKNSDQAKVVRTMLLQSMKRARYDVNNVGHFALQLLKYCHFTSPIRRVADFMIHTLIDELESFDYSSDSMERLEGEFTEIADKASSTEKIAQLIEEEALMMAMAEYMEGHIGEEFKGIVTKVSQTGMLIETDGMITGKVAFENMIDDYYYYVAENNAIIGKHTKKKYQIGKRVCVIVKDACKKTRTIDFEIGKEKSLRKKS